MANRYEAALTTFSVVGALWSISAGATLGAGYTILMDSDFDDKKAVKKVAWRACGGGLLVFGMYLWAPCWLRQTWMQRLDNY